MADSRLDIDYRCVHCWQFINSTSDPRVLPCKHISCMSCLEEEYEHRKGVECPQCTIFHEIANVADIPKLVPKKPEATTTRFKCDRKGCIDKPVTNFCVDCKHKLCEDHLQIHLAYFDDEHDVVPIHELVDPPKKYTKVCCEHHKNQEVNKACKTCDSLFCDDCEPSDHCNGSLSGHQIRSLALLTEKMKVDYKQLSNSVDEMITAMCQSRKKSWTNLDDEEEKCNKWIIEIKRIRDEQINTIREDSRKVIEKVEKYREMVTNETEAFEAELVVKKEQLEELRDRVHRLARDEHVTELIKQKQQVTEEMIKNLNVDIGSCELPGQHELINNGQTAHLDVDFLPIPSSLVFQSTHDVGSGCYSAWYKDNGDVLIGCEDGARLFDSKRKSLTKHANAFARVVSVIEHRQFIYILHTQDNVAFVELCTESLKRIETIFEYASDAQNASMMTVSDKHIVVFVPDDSTFPTRLIIYDFATKTHKSTKVKEPLVPYFRPDGTVLTVGVNKLMKCRVDNEVLVPLWECKGLQNIRTASSDSRGLGYGYPVRNQKCVYTVSPEGVTTVKETEKTYTHAGFHNWNDIGRSFRDHADSDQHKEAKLKIHMMDTQPPVSAMLNQQVREDQLSNNKQLTYILKALKFLTRQNISLRGVTYKKAAADDVSEPDSNFIQVLKVILAEQKKYQIETIRFTALLHSEL